MIEKIEIIAKLFKFRVNSSGKLCDCNTVDALWGALNHGSDKSKESNEVNPRGCNSNKNKVN